ncbi:MAG: Ig-like domain-containing protein [Ruminococcus sp.]|nr:Ig-like domain-containing protein [Ruminococcus sp.]
MISKGIMKKAVSLSLCLLLSLGSVPAVGAKTAEKSSDTTAAASVKSDSDKTKASKNEKKAKKKTVTLTQSITLYKGEKRQLDIVWQTKNSKAKITSSNKKVLSVKGKTMTAKKCGKSTVTVKVKDKNNTYIVKLKVTVKYSSYLSSVKYEKAKFAKYNKPATLVTHKEIKKGNTCKLKITGADSIEYITSDSSVASVSKKGVIKAKKKGSALIKAKVKANGQKYTFFTRIHVYDQKPDITITQSQIDDFFGSSGFIGSSIGVGQKSYFASKGYNYLGHPTMMVVGCYAFHNDNGSNGSTYQISYGGYTGPARYVVKRSGVKRLFINMGTNDMFGSAGFVFDNYVSYINGIRSENPGLPIYIEAMTPVYTAGEKTFLNNANVNALNAKLYEWCKDKQDIYYIDVNTPLKAGTSSLPSYYSSDNYVHLTNAAYAVWTDTLIEYVKKQLIKEQKAKDAVKTYTESKTKKNRKAARKVVNKLHNGALKTELLNKLKKKK